PLPRPGPPVISEPRVTEVEPTTAVLRAVVDPKQLDTTYQFQWITEAAFKSDGNSFGAGTASAPVTPADLGSVSREDHVQAAISGLSTRTAYRWRLVAINGQGESSPEGAFETPPPVSIRGLNTQAVAPEEVLLKAELDNNNSLQTGHYAICIGPEVSRYTRCVEGLLSAGSGEFKKIEAKFTGLTPNTTYHYRLTVENEYTSTGHPEETPDAAFTTEETISEEDASEGCANALLREENDSLALLDCRAYEQVSPVFKGGAGVGAMGIELSPGGDGAAFRSLGVFAGTTASQVVNPYF